MSTYMHATNATQAATQSATVLLFELLKMASGNGGAVVDGGIIVFGFACPRAPAALYPLNPKESLHNTPIK